MLKRHAIIKFIFIAIIAILGILLCVCPFSVPYSTNKYNGFVKATKKSLDLNGGVSALYECSLPADSRKNLSDAIDSSLEKLQTALKYERFTELEIRRQGGNKISLLASNSEIPGLYLNDVFELIEDSKKMFFTAESASDSNTPESLLNSSDLESVTPDYDYESAQIGLTLKFASSSKNKIKHIKDVSKNTTDKKIYIYLEKISSDNVFVELDYKDLKEDEIFVTSSGTYSTEDNTSARELAYNITGGMLDVKLKLKEVSKISPILGKNTQLYIGIAMIVVILIAFIFMWIRYADLGLLAILSLTFYLIFFAFLMQSIPFIMLNIAGVVGCVMAFIITVFAHSFVFEKIREEYSVGKKIHLSCKSGQKKALFPLLDVSAIIAIASILIWALVPSSLKCFAITLFLGSILSFICTQLLLRWFINIYLKINSTKSKKLHLYRDKNIIEIKEDEVEIISEENVSSQEEVENA